MQAFLFYIDDWISSKHVELMDAAEERGYLRLLLRAAKEDDCGIPDDDAQLAIMSMLGAQWGKPTADKSRRFGTKTSGEKLRECFVSKNGRLYNSRLLREFENQQRVKAARAAAGVKGGRPRKQTETNCLTNGIANGKQTETNHSLGLGLCTSSEVLKEQKTEENTTVPRWTIDEHFQMFAAVARKFWKDLLDEDLNGWYWEWTNLDHDQRSLAIQRVNERISAGENWRKVFKPTYFTRGDWKRPIIPAELNGNGFHGKQPVPDYKPGREIERYFKPVEN